MPFGGLSRAGEIDRGPSDSHRRQSPILLTTGRYRHSVQVGTNGRATRPSRTTARRRCSTRDQRIRRRLDVRGPGARQPGERRRDPDPGRQRRDRVVPRDPGRRPRLRPRGGRSLRLLAKRHRPDRFTAASSPSAPGGALFPARRLGRWALAFTLATASAGDAAPGANERPQTNRSQPRIGTS